jgi:hypothetical protein
MVEAALREEVGLGKHKGVIFKHTPWWGRVGAQSSRVCMRRVGSGKGVDVEERKQRLVNL